MTKTSKIDILAFGAHPDDVDACVGGTLAKSVKQGLKVGIVDLTGGGNSETANAKERILESQKAADILGVSFRLNLNLPDRGLRISNVNEDKIIKVIRNYYPDIVLIPHWHDRHKAHRDASVLLERAIQTAKYSKIEPGTKPHKVKTILYYMIHYEFEPAFIFDITETHEQKMKALYCHKSQMFTKSKKGEYTKKLIDPDFIEAWVARSRWYGYISGVKYGEAFDMRRSPGLNSLRSLVSIYR